MWGFTPILSKEDIHKYWGVPLRKSGEPHTKVWGISFDIYSPYFSMGLQIGVVAKCFFCGNPTLKCGECSDYRRE
jgi:hypothetical protein